LLARLDVAVDGDRVVGLSASPPLAAKVLAGIHGPELLLVGAAASLVEGDELAVSLRLGPGARLTVRTAAATLAHPCPGAGSTTFDVHADLGPGASLAWLPEPLVACAGCRHGGRARVRLAAGAAAVWSETLVLGRWGERPGDVAVRLDVDLAGTPLLRDGLRAGPSAPAWDGPAVLDGTRHLGSVALLGLRPRAGPVQRRTVLALAGEGALVRAAGSDAASVERRLAPWRSAFVADLATVVPAGGDGFADGRNGSGNGHRPATPASCEGNAPSLRFGASPKG
jgi:urease accessory protein